MSKTDQTLFNRATLKVYDRPTLRAADDAMYLAKRQGQDGDLVFAKTSHQRGQEK